MSIVYFVIKYRNYQKNVRDEPPLDELENVVEIDDIGNENYPLSAHSAHNGSSVDESSEIESL